MVWKATARTRTRTRRVWSRDIGDDVVAGAMAAGSAPRSQPGTISCGTATSSWEDCPSSQLLCWGGPGNVGLKWTFPEIPPWNPRANERPPGGEVDFFTPGHAKWIFGDVVTDQPTSMYHTRSNPQIAVTSLDADRTDWIDPEGLRHLAEDRSAGHVGGSQPEDGYPRRPLPSPRTR